MGHRHTPAGLQIRLLGPFEVLCGGGRVAVKAGRQQAVVALLAVSAPRALSIDTLVDELWGERPPDSAVHAVHVAISALRKLLGVQSIESTPAGYLLDVEADRVDARRFEGLIEEAGRVPREDPAGAQELFERALGYWRGPPLAEFEQFEWARREANRLVELRTVGLEGLAEARLACEEHGEVIGALTALAAANPLRERPRRLLMLALYRAGRHAEALAVYRDAVAALDEIGLQPGPELRRLEAQILSHDISLVPPGIPQGEVRAAGATESVTPSASLPVDAIVSASEERGRARRETHRRSRKVVTALLCEVTSSTIAGDELDPEVLHEVMNRCREELRSTIELHGGTVDKHVGGSVLAVFGIPRVHEDDALRAVRAADEIRGRLPVVAAELGMALSSRTAINTGVVLTDEAGDAASGEAVSVAARLQQAAGPGEIVLAEATRRLVRDAVKVKSLEPLVVNGRAEPVPTFRLLAVDPLAPGVARHLGAALIGRERELDLLRAAWGRSVDESGCHLFTLLGAAGVGKSRLIGELIKRVRDAATVLQGRCLHYGEGITFSPLLEALTTVGESAEPVLERFSRGGAATPEELFFEVRGLLEALALQRPVILHVDDLQWAETMLLDLLDHVAALSRGAPILLLCSARPELMEERPTWGGGKLNATTVLLEPLAATDCEVLLDQLGDGLTSEARGRVIAASEGNPLFLEEMAALTRERGTVGVPSTIHSLLSARLDGLRTEERELLECGAIEGEVFHGMPLRALSDATAGDLEGVIAGLVRKELIRPHPATFEGDRAFRFRHLLIRDAAYDSLPKAARAELHEQFAGWLEDNARKLAELDEISGWHLEQAVRFRRELGRDVPSALAQRGAEHLHIAGRRASERGDAAAAISLLERTLALAPDDTRLTATASVDLAEQLLDTGDFARVDKLLLAAESDPNVTDLAALTRFEWMLHAEPQGAIRAIQGRLPPIVERCGKAADARGLAKAHWVASQIHWWLAEATPAGEELRLVADYAGKAGDRGMRTRALGEYVKTLVYGPADAPTLAAEISVIAAEDVGPYLSAFLDLGRAELERLHGSFDEARRFTQQAIDGFGSLGMGAVQGGLEQDLGQIELSAGDPAAALSALLRSDAILAELSERSFRSTTQALIADAHERLGQRDAARAAIGLSDQLSAAEDVLNYLVTYPVRARLALDHGDHVAAEQWARSAVAYASRTDFTRHIAETRLDLARVLKAIGRREEAKSEAREAMTLFEAKGDRPGAAATQAMLDKLGRPE